MPYFLLIGAGFSRKWHSNKEHQRTPNANGSDAPTHLLSPADRCNARDGVMGEVNVLDFSAVIKFRDDRRGVARDG
jgi:hypothetical protein